MADSCGFAGCGATEIAAKKNKMFFRMHDRKLRLARSTAVGGGVHPRTMPTEGACRKMDFSPLRHPRESAGPAAVRAYRVPAFARMTDWQGIASTALQA